MPPFMWQQSTPFGAMPLLPGMSGLPGVLNGVVLSPEDSGSGATLFRDATSMPWDWLMTDSLGLEALDHSLSWPHAPQHVAKRFIWQLTSESPPSPAAQACWAPCRPPSCSATTAATRGSACTTSTGTTTAARRRPRCSVMACRRLRHAVLVTAEPVGGWIRG